MDPRDDTVDCTAQDFWIWRHADDSHAVLGGLIIAGAGDPSQCVICASSDMERSYVSNLIRVEYSQAILYGKILMVYVFPNRDAVLDELSFLEWKDHRLFESLSVDPAPMPILTGKLIERMKSGEESEIPPGLYIEGMVLLLAADPDFPHADTYRAILSRDPGMIAALKEQMMTMFREKDTSAFLYALALVSLVPEDSTVTAVLAQGLFTWDGINAHDDISHLLRIVREDRSSSAETNLIAASAAMAIGDMALGEHLLEDVRSTDAQQEREVAEQMLADIRRDQRIDSARQAMNRQDFEGAIRLIMEVSKADRTALDFFLLGESQQGLGLFVQSIENLARAIDMGCEEKDAYNDLSIAYYLSNRFDEAIDVAEWGLNLWPNDEKLMFNQLIYLLQADRVEEARTILDQLRAMEIEDEEIRESLEEMLDEA